MNKLINKLLCFLLLSLSSLLFSACNDIGKTTTQENIKKPSYNPSVSNSPNENISVNSKVSRNKTNNSKWEKIKINSNKSFDFLEFVDNLHGLTANYDGEIFRTSDGGLTWEPLPFSMPDKSRLSEITFVSPTMGWMIIEKPEKETENNASEILHTQDGGQTWTSQFVGEDTGFEKLAFFDSKIGWAVGSKTSKQEILDVGIFILHTRDGGETWVNISQKLSKIEEAKQSNVLRIRNIYLTESEKVTILTTENLLFGTDDGGETWIPTGKVPDDGMIPLFISSHITDRNMFAGVDGKEGIGSVFLTRNDDDSWTKYVLSGFYLKDAKHISKKQIIACGSMFVEDSTDVNRGKRVGVILYSPDEGQNWSVVYQNKEIAKLNSIQIVDETKVVAVGDNGLMIKTQINEIFHY